MTAPERRRPLPALIFIAVLCVLTAVVWFRVLHHNDSPKKSASSSSSCPSPSPTPTPTVLPTPARVSVVVLNASQRNGLAGKTTKLLAKRGFKVGTATNDDAQYGGHGTLATVGEIRYGPAGYASATLLSFYFPGATLKPIDTTATTVYVALGTGYKSVPTAAQVGKAIAAQHRSISPTLVPAPAASSSTPGC